MTINKNPFVTPNNKSCINKICRLENWGLFAYVISRKRRASERKKLRDNVFQLKWRSHAKIQLIWSKKQKQPKLSSPFSTSVFSCKMLLSSKTLTLLCITNMPTMLYAACPEKWSEVFNLGEGWWGNSVPSFWIFWIRPSYGLAFWFYPLVSEGRELYSEYLPSPTSFQKWVQANCYHLTNYYP